MTSGKGLVRNRNIPAKTTVYIIHNCTEIPAVRSFVVLPRIGKVIMYHLVDNRVFPHLLVKVEGGTET